jgi:hypothetical protein
VKHTTDNMSKITGRDRTETLLEDGQTKAVVGADVLGRAEVKEALPTIEESITALPLPSAPTLAVAIVSSGPPVPSRPSLSAPSSAKATATIISVEMSYNGSVNE